MLIGNDYYFDLLQPRKIDLGNNLYLFQSKLGWVFGGKVETKTEVVSEQNLLVHRHTKQTPPHITCLPQLSLPLQ